MAESNTYYYIVLTDMYTYKNVEYLLYEPNDDFMVKYRLGVQLIKIE